MQFPTYLSLSNYFGLIATVLLSFNFLLGCLLGTTYKKLSFWKALPANIKKISIYNLHNLTAYIALIFVVLHPLMLVLDRTIDFSLVDIIYPFHLEFQKVFSFFGSVSLVAILMVIISSQKKLKEKMSFRSWKNIHLISYATAILFSIHGIIMNPQLKNKPVDYFDGEKLISEICFLVLILATVLRYRYHLRTRKSQRYIAL